MNVRTVLRHILAEYAVPGAPESLHELLYDTVIRAAEVLILREGNRQREWHGTVSTEVRHPVEIPGQGSVDQLVRLVVFFGGMRDNYPPVLAGGGVPKEPDSQGLYPIDLKVDLDPRVGRARGYSLDDVDYILRSEIRRTLDHEMSHVQRFSMLGKEKVGKSLLSYPKTNRFGALQYLRHPAEWDAFMSSMITAYRDASQKPVTVLELIELSGNDIKEFENVGKNSPKWRKRVLSRLHREGVPIRRWA